jgi:hypothetical protein
MSSFERRYTDRQRSIVYELKLGGKSGSEIAARCAQGVGDEPPFEITRVTANRLAGEEREFERGRPSKLAQANPAAAIEQVSLNMIGQLEDWVGRQKPGAVNSTEFARVARTLEKLHSIARAGMTPNGNGSNGNDQRDCERSFIERLADELPHDPAAGPA